MKTKKPVRIAFDIGGVLSKYADILRPIVKALQKDKAVEVHVITDMHKRAESLAMLRMNGFKIPAKRLHNADFETYGEACKAVLLVELGIDVMVDDFPAYVAEGCPLRLLALPAIHQPYYAPTWKTPKSVGDFGRKGRVEAAQARLAELRVRDIRAGLSKR